MIAVRPVVVLFGSRVLAMEGGASSSAAARVRFLLAGQEFLREVKYEIRYIRFLLQHGFTLSYCRTGYDALLSNDVEKWIRVAKRMPPSSRILRVRRELQVLMRHAARLLRVGLANRTRVR